MINIFVSRPLCASIIRARRKKKKSSVLPFLPHFGSVQAASRNSLPLLNFHADVRKV